MQIGLGLGAYFNPGDKDTGITEIILNNSLFVAKNGSDATGTRARLDLPFLTITAAVAAALAGDTIIIYPGDYDETDLLKNGVNYFFQSGAQVIYTGVSTTGIFDDKGAAVVSTIIGGHFKHPTTGGAIFRVDNAGSDISAQFTSMDSGGADVECYCNAGILKMQFNFCTIGLIDAEGTGTVFVTANRIAGTLCSFDGGTLYVTANYHEGNGGKHNIQITGTAFLNINFINADNVPSVASDGSIQLQEDCKGYISCLQCIKNTGNSPIIASNLEAAGLDFSFSGFYNNKVANASAYIALLAQTASITAPNAITFQSFQGRVNTATHTVSTNSSGFTADYKGLNLYVNKIFEPVDLVKIVGVIDVDPDV